VVLERSREGEKSFFVEGCELNNNNKKEKENANECLRGNKKKNERRSTL
jgi:hypothetical protein